MNYFKSPFSGKSLQAQVTNPNIIVGRHSYYSGYYHGHSFDECARYLSTEPDVSDKLVIGNFCAIGSGAVFMMAGNQGHRIDWISTFPFSPEEFGNGVQSGFERAGDTIIGNDVWIGSEAMIMPGVTIGDGAVIGARSVITKNVEPYSIVVGNNHVVRLRFDEEAVSMLLEIQWWDWSIEHIKQAMKIMCSGDVFALGDYYREHIA